LNRVVKIGCCGFPGGQEKYFKNYRVVELQNTFYDLPSRDWAEKIRGKAPGDFEFTVKAWQVITHPSTSPTWRRVKKSKLTGELSNYGYLKPTMENFKALEMLIDIANILQSRIIVFQTPASLPFSDESVKWVNEFFKTVTSSWSGFVFGWEPRGEWLKRVDVLSKILSDNNIIHVVDIFKSKPLHLVDGILYIRLHGIGPGEVNYRYKYSVEDFEKLYSMLKEIDFKQAYIMFNNVYMRDDSIEFRKYLSSKSEFTVM